MKIVNDLLPASKYKLKAPYTMKPQYITVHNTWNDAPAENEVAYMKRNNTEVGFHIAIDDKEVRIGIPLNRNAFHAGDGWKGNGNRKSIGVEICYSRSGGQRYRDAEENAVQYIAQYLYDNKWDISRVKKHEDWSGKHCPHRILDEGRWESFLARIDEQLMKLKGGNNMAEIYDPGTKTLKDNTDKYLDKAVKDGIINVSHLNTYRAGKMTISHLIGLDITIRLRDKK